MSHLYLTGTRHPGKALCRFVPDFVEMLLDQGHHLITSNKQGVDEAVIAHCERHQRPLQVCVFLTEHNFYQNRRIRVEADSINVQPIYSPTWLRFRHLAEQTEKMIFLHAGKTRGAVKSIPTIDAFAAACEKRGVTAEQLIVQHQCRAWVSVTELRQCPLVGTAHLYLYPRPVYGLHGDQHCVGHYRLETWRRINQIVQPGIGRRELVLANASRQQAALELLLHALLEVNATPPPRLIIHHMLPSLHRAPYCRGEYQPLRDEVRALLADVPQVHWQRDSQASLLQAIGAPFQSQNALWYHDHLTAATKGLYA